MPAAQLQSLSIALDEPDHPLVFALAGQDAVSVPRNGKKTDIWRNDFLVLPLPLSEKREARLGLLLVSPSRGGADARWAAELLGQKLARLRTASALVEGRPHSSRLRPIEARLRLTSSCR